MSIYIHIPFCNQICSYCDFCKMIYNDKFVNAYLDSLENEIKEKYNNDIVKTIYIGGGTPSCLNLKQLKRLFEIIRIFNIDLDEFTFECNIDSLTEEKIKLLSDNNVNRISIGIESFDEKCLKFLNRTCNYNEAKEKIELLKKYGISNINLDLIYALPNQTLDNLKDDLDLITSLDISHISTYSLIIEDNTLLKNQKVECIDEDLDFIMYNYICDYLKDKDFIHYEISNFAKKGYESKHNLVYWNNLEYYGFGLGASGYVESVRYTNTRNLTNYIKGNYLFESEYQTESLKKENALILGLRKIRGIDKRDFENRYNDNLKEKKIVKRLLSEGFLQEDETHIYINSKYIYTSNNILVEIIGEI